MTVRVGVLAYGSLIDDPGNELSEALVERRAGFRTPFRVEFARSSSRRNGAPTLVPVDEGGAHVEATVLVLRGGISVKEARDMVYRREVNAVDNQARRYAPDPSKHNQVYVETLPDFAGIDWVLYTRISSNIECLTAERLAELAIESARRSDGNERRDGITYLQRALFNEIRTPLSDAYREAVLRKTGATSLDRAWEKASASI